MCKREGEREREMKGEKGRRRSAMVGTTSRQAYSEPCFFDGRSYRPGSQPGRKRWPPPPGSHLNLLAALRMTDRQILWSRNTSTLYIFKTPTHFFPSCTINVIHFLCLLFTHVQYPVLKSLTNQSVKGQYVTKVFFFFGR